MKQINVKAIFAIFLGVTLLLGISCSDDPDVVLEQEPDNPTISVSHENGLDNLEVLVGGTLNLTITVMAEAGLSSVSIDGENIKLYAQGDTADVVKYDYIPTEEGEASLVFTVEDSRGITASSTTVSVVATGDPGFVLADFGGESGSTVNLSTIDPDHWDGDRTITSFAVNGNLVSNATFENVNNQFTIETGAANPDADAPLEYQGKTMKVSKNPAGWGTAGWSHIMFDFGTVLDQSMVEALPQVNADKSGLTSGTKYIEIEVYYEDSDALPFSMLTGNDVTVGDNPAFGSDKTKGYSIFLMLTKHADHRLNPDGSGMYIGYEEYIETANTWTTLRFDELYLESVENFFASGNESAASADVVDGVKIVAGGGYGDGQSTNAIYFRDLRIVDAD